MGRILYRSIEEMTAPETLSDLVQEPVSATCLTPFETVGWSSTESEFLAVDRCDARQPRYLLKRLRRERDWVMQATDDQYWRAIAVWQHGLLDRLPAGIDHGIIACSADDDGYAILMHNISHALMRDDEPMSAEDNALVLDALAALHAAFWQDPCLDDPALHLCRPQDFFSHGSPAKIQRIAAKSPSHVLEIILEGWRQLPRFVDGDAAALMRTLAQDPSSLCVALADFPHTLVHSDCRRANLGIERRQHPRLILLDWTRPVRTVPAVDLAWYLATIVSGHLPMSFEQAIDLYKQRLASRLGDGFHESWWQPQLELSLLGVSLLIGPFKAFFAQNSESDYFRQQDRADLQWWSEQARKGARWLA